MALLEAEEKEGLSQEERGSPGAKAPLQFSLHRTGEKPRTLRSMVKNRKPFLSCILAHTFPIPSLAETYHPKGFT